LVRLSQVAVDAAAFPDVAGLPYGTTDPDMSESVH
jgi:hypothetical protein